MPTNNKREPIRLPVLQNWDCHVCGTCCREYLVRLSDSEVRMIQLQNWDVEKDLGGYGPIKSKGLIWKNHFLNHRPDGACVFLNESNLCRIHEKFGLAGKPLPCQVFPYVLNPTGKVWSVGVRFACPSASRNLGTPALEQKVAIENFRDVLVDREKFEISISDNPVKPKLDSAVSTNWEIIYSLRDTLKDILFQTRDNIPLGLRRIFAFAREVRSTRLDQLEVSQVIDFLSIFSKMAISEVPVDSYSLSAPGWVENVLFRQMCALFTRKDHGPNRGLAARGRFSLFMAAIYFAWGNGMVPKLNSFSADIAFEDIQKSRRELDSECQELLFRYFYTKLESLQFFGASSFGVPFWEGLNMLLVMYPIIVWTALSLKPSEKFLHQLEKAIAIVDDHFGFNKILGSLRQRTSFSLLEKQDGIPKLISWYSRAPVV